MSNSFSSSYNSCVVSNNDPVIDELEAVCVQPQRSSPTITGRGIDLVDYDSLPGSEDGFSNASLPSRFSSSSSLCSHQSFQGRSSLCSARTDEYDSSVHDDSALEEIISKLSAVPNEDLLGLGDFVMGLEKMILGVVLPHNDDTYTDIALRIALLRRHIDFCDIGERINDLEMFRDTTIREGYDPSRYSNRRCSLFMRCCCFLVRSNLPHVVCLRNVFLFFASNLYFDWATYAPCEWLDSNGYTASSLLELLCDLL
ncbi:hypothetical protein [Candidatus Ichthyocystis sparus]|uniref:hypothetical protein n=1 Tax=Candidatus Ichthyocystis sparus TaxID=1561004 RepID=UPI000B8969F1|nr:hypothetical protein [Candidatus Ichthyocystis sparus]